MSKVFSAIGKIVFFFFVLGAGLIFFASTKNDTPSSSESHSKETVEVSAVELYNDYNANGVAADNKYGDAIVKVTGTVTGVDKDIMGTPFVLLDTGVMFQSIQCMITDSQWEIDQAAKLSVGDSIVMRGEDPSFVVNVLLTDCEILSDVD